MKHLILLLSLPLLLMSFNVHGYHDLTKLHFEVKDRIPVTLTLGNQVYGPSSSFHINAIPGRHFLRIERIQHTYYGSHSQTLYQGHITLRPSTEVHAVLNRMFSLSIFETPVYYAHTPSWGQNTGWSHQSEQYHHGYGDYQVCYDAPQPVILPMSEPAFNALVNTIRNQSFDSTKREVARHALANNYITSSQASRLISLFTFESSKLEIAKIAYHSTIDSENYYIVFNTFTFSSSVRDLSAYIARV